MKILKSFWLPGCLLLLAALLIPSGCSGNREAVLQEEITSLQEQLNRQQESLAALEEEKTVLEDRLLETIEQDSRDLLFSALRAVHHIKNEDYGALGEMAHPEEDVRFSPYGYVNLDQDLKFSGRQFPLLASGNQDYLWGAYDGSGEPIELGFQEYFRTFVFPVDFTAPHMIGVNRVIGTGNSLINLEEVYPGASFVEFHFTGFNPEYDGMDWRSLRLVFQPLEGNWKLVGIVSDQWTI